MMSVEKIAVIGMGQMGSGMAERLQTSGHDVIGCEDPFGRSEIGKPCRMAAAEAVAPPVGAGQERRQVFAVGRLQPMPAKLRQRRGPRRGEDGGEDVDHMAGLMRLHRRSDPRGPGGDQRGGNRRL